MTALLLFIIIGTIIAAFSDLNPRRRLRESPDNKSHTAYVKDGKCYNRFGHWIGNESSIRRTINVSGTPDKPIFISSQQDLERHSEITFP